ncbi:hypothetical protein [Streptomyces sp. AB3(2024)]|uniref:hypothetical protein n=1 Tax=Streptomyces sp. AB3(2024) TaxID=3317321 RepID=UPI0035A28BEA
MDEFIDAALGFPAGIFSVALAVVVVYWLVVLFGVVGHDAWESDAGSGALGAPGVPVAVSVSVRSRRGRGTRRCAGCRARSCCR